MNRELSSYLIGQDTETRISTLAFFLNFIISFKDMVHWLDIYLVYVMIPPTVLPLLWPSARPLRCR